MYPQWLVQLRGRGRAELTWFAQELRRFYPFAPAVGAKVREELEWRGHRLPRGGLVLLDLYGTSHDPRRWPEPDRFDRLPPQDLAIPPRRIPTRPRSGVVLSEVRQVTAGATGRSPRRFGRAGTGNR